MKHDDRRPSVAVIAAIPMSLQVFMRHHLQVAAQHFETTAICSDTTALKTLLPTVTCLDVSIRRDIAPLADLLAVWRLYRLFRSRNYDLVHSLTPKAGLLAMLSAWIAGVPIRIHVFTGQVWVTRSGFSRWLLKSIDRMIAALSTDILVDSPSQRDFLVSEGIVAGSRAHVLAHGSISGVDADRFRPDASRGAAVRAALGIPADAVVLLYLGRINRDKGIRDLCRAFVAAAEERTDLWLLLVGPDEAGESDRVLSLCASMSDRVRRVDFTSSPEHYMQCADVFCLPSYREGFGTSVIEAAACGIPSIASRIYGLTDAVKDGHTGLLHPPHDVDALALCIQHLANSPQERQRMGLLARERAITLFSQQAITLALMRYYWQTLECKHQ